MSVLVADMPGSCHLSVLLGVEAKILVVHIPCSVSLGIVLLVLARTVHGDKPWFFVRLYCTSSADSRFMFYIYCRRTQYNIKNEYKNLQKLVVFSNRKHMYMYP
jgi:hypothetical protein